MAMVPSEMCKVQHEVTLVDKPNIKSSIWGSFGFVPDEDGKLSNVKKPQCKNCCMTISTKTSNTTNLHVHLCQKHPQLYTGQMKTSGKESNMMTSKERVSSKTLKNLFEARMKLSSSSREHKELTKSVIYFLAKDMQPAYTVEESGFPHILSKFNPHNDLLS